MPRWSQLEESSSSNDSAGDDETHPIRESGHRVRTQSSIPLRSRSRSRTPQPHRSQIILDLDLGTLDEPLAQVVPAVGPLFRSGIAWWAKPLHRAIAASRAHHILTQKPNTHMNHASGCSGMVSELLTAQAILENVRAHLTIVLDLHFCSIGQPQRRKIEFFVPLAYQDCSFCELTPTQD